MKKIEEIAKRALPLKVAERELNVGHTIVEKTKRLFQERILNLIKQETKETNLITLFQLQLIIFLVDLHYELNWELNEEELAYGKL